jgi:hypothetical protein
MLMSTVDAVTQEDLALVRAKKQRDLALVRANHVRLVRADLKRQVKAGRDLRALILDPPEVLLTADVFTLLQWLPRVGP